MRLQSLRIFVPILAILTLCTSATAQTTPNSTPQTTSAAALSNEEVLRPELRLRRLIDEVKTARELIILQREEIKSADAELEVEKQNSASLEKSTALAEREIKLLNEADQVKTQALGFSEKDRQRLKRDLSSTRKIAFWTTAAAAALASVLILK
jgi:hypothetical protein